jgi:phage protein D
MQTEAELKAALDSAIADAKAWSQDNAKYRNEVQEQRKLVKAAQETAQRYAGSAQKHADDATYWQRRYRMVAACLTTLLDNEEFDYRA